MYVVDSTWHQAITRGHTPYRSMNRLLHAFVGAVREHVHSLRDRSNIGIPKFLT